MRGGGGERSAAQVDVATLDFLVTLRREAAPQGNGGWAFSILGLRGARLRRGGGEQGQGGRRWLQRKYFDVAAIFEMLTQRGGEGLQKSKSQTCNFQNDETIL